MPEYYAPSQAETEFTTSGVMATYIDIKICPSSPEANEPVQISAGLYYLGTGLIKKYLEGYPLNVTVIFDGQVIFWGSMISSDLTLATGCPNPVSFVPEEPGMYQIDVEYEGGIGYAPSSATKYFNIAEPVIWIPTSITADVTHPAINIHEVQTIYGRLMDDYGTPIPGQFVEIHGKRGTYSSDILGHVYTDSNGDYAFSFDVGDYVGHWMLWAKFQGGEAEGYMMTGASAPIGMVSY